MWAAYTVTYTTYVGVFAVSLHSSICIFKYTRKSRSITDANKLNECGKIHKYNIQSAHSLFSFKLKLKSRAGPERVQSESNFNFASNLESDNAGGGGRSQAQRGGGRAQPQRRRQSRVNSQTLGKHVERRWRLKMRAIFIVFFPCNFRALKIALQTKETE